MPRSFSFSKRRRGLDHARELVAEIADGAAQERQAEARRETRDLVPARITRARGGAGRVDEGVGAGQQRAGAVDRIGLEAVESAGEPRAHAALDVDVDLAAACAHPEIGVGAGKGVAAETSVLERAVEPPESRSRVQPLDDTEPVAHCRWSVERREGDSLSGVEHRCSGEGREATVARCARQRGSWRARSRGGKRPLHCRRPGDGAAPRPEGSAKTGSTGSLELEAVR